MKNVQNVYAVYNNTFVEFNDHCNVTMRDNNCMYPFSTCIRKISRYFLSLYVFPSRSVEQKLNKSKQQNDLRGRITHFIDSEERLSLLFSFAKKIFNSSYGLVGYDLSRDNK